MPMVATDIERLIRARLPDAEVTIRDLAGDGDHYAATVISESFRGKSRVQQHQIVYQSLQGQMGGVLHALALQTGVPDCLDDRPIWGCLMKRGREFRDRAGRRIMALDSERGPLFRPIVPHQHSRVTYAELLFDLVFVFAVTQVSHTLLAHFTLLGAMQTTLLLLSVWWTWVYTSWITNWLNPELTPVRVLLFLLMLGGLVLSTSIPLAFEARGLWFAIAYAAMQVGRTVFWVLSTPRARKAARMNAIRVLIWLSISAAFWIAGGFAEGQQRLIFWATALAIEYVSPAMRFWLPVYGASSVADWLVEGSHMAGGW